MYMKKGMFHKYQPWLGTIKKVITPKFKARIINNKSLFTNLKFIIIDMMIK